MTRHSGHSTQPASQTNTYVSHRDGKLVSGKQQGIIEFTEEYARESRKKQLDWELLSRCSFLIDGWISSKKYDCEHDRKLFSARAPLRKDLEFFNCQTIDVNINWAASLTYLSTQWSYWSTWDDGPLCMPSNREVPLHVHCCWERDCKGDLSYH